MTNPPVRSVYIEFYDNFLCKMLTSHQSTDFSLLKVSHYTVMCMAKYINFVCSSVLPKQTLRLAWRTKFWWSHWLHQLLHSHIKEKSILKACWANMHYVCWREHCYGRTAFYIVVVITLTSILGESGQANLPLFTGLNTVIIALYMCMQVELV